MIAYKLFKVRNEKLFSLYIYTNEEVPMGKWVDAKVGILAKDGKHVKSKLGNLAYRPGWHSCNIPLADHIGTRQADGTLAQAKDTVWCEIEIGEDIDYTPQAQYINDKGKVIASKSYLKEIPVDGFYYYQTNPNAKARWIISGEIKVLRILSQQEVEDICKANGVEAQKVA